MNHSVFRFAAGLALAASMAFSAGAAHAAGEASRSPGYYDWSFAGMFGTYDRAQLQRGFQVYYENCSACHALERIAFRNLMEPGGPEFPEEEVRAIAAGYFVMDGPDEFGEMFEREGRLSDRIPPPFPNQEAATAAMGAYPPDLSLITKARAPKRGFPNFLIDFFTQYQEYGADYVVALLTGYEDPPEQYADNPLSYNPYFLAGDFIAMAPPLFDGMHAYADGTPETEEQYALDVAAFLMWTAEPHLEQRKEMGFRVMAFLLIFGSLVYFTKRKVWASVKH